MMPRLAVMALVAAATLNAACPGRGLPPRIPVEGEEELPPLDCDACDLTHPVNAVLASEFVKLGLVPRLAGTDELCRRAGFDQGQKHVARRRGRGRDDRVFALHRAFARGQPFQPDAGGAGQRNQR